MSADWKVIRRESLLTSYVFSVERRVVDTGTEELVRDVVLHRGAVAIVAVDDLERVGVIRQYRVALEREHYEIPAGSVEEHEGDLLAVAVRELREEMGCEAQTWRPIGTFLNSPGWTNQTIAIFEARGLTHMPRQTMGPEEAASTIEWWDRDQCRVFLSSSGPIDATTTIGLQHFLWASGD